MSSMSKAGLDGRKSKENGHVDDELARIRNMSQQPSQP